MNFKTMLRTGAVALSCLTAVAQQHQPVEATTEASAEQQNLIERAAAAGQFQTLLAAVEAAGLTGTLSGKGPFTVFAPTDAAFARLGKQAIAELLLPQNKARLTAILTYHVLGSAEPAAKVVTATRLATLQGCGLAVGVRRQGDRIETVTVGGATVTATDVTASNGVIHVIDTVLLPPGNLVEVAAKAEKFATLLAAAKAAGLADTLAGKGPFTVFAPTDAAFAALGSDALASLLQPQNKAALAAILKRHVVAGRLLAAAAAKLDAVQPLQGDELALRLADGKLHVGAAVVTTADIEAANGVIHVIDKVLQD